MCPNQRNTRANLQHSSPLRHHSNRVHHIMTQRRSQFLIFLQKRDKRSITPLLHHRIRFEIERKRQKLHQQSFLEHGDLAALKHICPRTRYLHARTSNSIEPLKFSIFSPTSNLFNLSAVHQRQNSVHQLELG